MLSMLLSLWAYLKVACDITLSLLQHLCNSVLQRVTGIVARRTIDNPLDIVLSPIKSIDALKISVIIPCYNEQANIGQTVSTALQDANVEVIVSDGGSTDGTLETLQPFVSAGSVRLVTGGRSRAQSQIIGVSTAQPPKDNTESVLLFLHADSTLPPDYGRLVREALDDNQQKYSGGSFSFKLDSSPTAGCECSCTDLSLRFLQWGTNMRSKYLSLPYGDQGLFLRRSVYDQLGGFRDIPIMEDIELVCELRRRHGKLCILDEPVVTSGRRWRMFGVVRNTLMNQVMLWGWHMGVPHAELVKWYYGMSSAKGY